MSTKDKPLPEIEMWSTNPLDDKALFEMIEASNAYALCKFTDPVNKIYWDMLLAVSGYIPQLLKIAVEDRRKNQSVPQP
jgi:hypothetical protein